MAKTYSKFEYNSSTDKEFFVGNLNKTKTRDEIFQELTQIEIERLGGEKLYIKKFNMPKFNARRNTEGQLLLNLGYAFVTTSKQEMAEELIEKGRMKMEDGTDLEFKSINRTKRLVANQKCKEKNLSKYNNADGRNSDNDNNWRNSDFNSFENLGNIMCQPHKEPVSKENNNSFLWAPLDWNQNSTENVSSTRKKSIFEIYSSGSEPEQ